MALDSKYDQAYAEVKQLSETFANSEAARMLGQRGLEFEVTVGPRCEALAIVFSSDGTVSDQKVWEHIREIQPRVAEDVTLVCVDW